MYSNKLYMCQHMYISYLSSFYMIATFYADRHHVEVEQGHACNGV